MIKAILLDYSGVVRQQGDLMEKMVEFCPDEFTHQKAVELYNKAKIMNISNQEYETAFSQNAWDFYYNEITLHEGFMNFIENNKLPIYIASNHISSIINKELESLSLNNFFSKIFVSDKLGVAKPNKEFFEKILKDLNLKPSEVIFADDQKKNLVSAKEMGIKTIWVNNTSVDPFGNNFEIIPDYEIYNLIKINEIISELNE